MATKKTRSTPHLQIHNPSHPEWRISVAWTPSPMANSPRRERLLWEELAHGRWHTVSTRPVGEYEPSKLTLELITDLTPGDQFMALHYPQVFALTEVPIVVNSGQAIVTVTKNDESRVVYLGARVPVAKVN